MERPTQGIRCPACSKINAEPAAKCSRCQCDLTALQKVRDAARRLGRQSLTHLLHGEPQEALETAERSWDTARSPQAAALAGIAAIQARDLAALLRWQNQA